MAGGLQTSCRKNAQQPVPTGSLGSHTVRHSLAGAGCSGRVVRHAAEAVPVRRSRLVFPIMFFAWLVVLGSKPSDAEASVGLSPYLMQERSMETTVARRPTVPAGANVGPLCAETLSAGPGRADDLVRDAGLIPWT